MNFFARGMIKMKCFYCKKNFEGNGIMCPNCRSVGYFVPYVKAHKCQSFHQQEGAQRGHCENYLMCRPLKMALQKKTIFEKNLGYIVCPYPEENLSRIIYGPLTIEDIQLNYPECIDL